MNQRFLSVLVFAFVVAGGASFLLYRLMASGVSAHSGPATAPVVLAARDLEAGTLIQEGDLKIGAWPGTLPGGAAKKKEEIVGRGVLANTLANEPVVESRLALRGAGAGLAAMIPKGMRAVAVHVNDVVGVAGFVVPGMRVDVLISGNPPGAAAAGSVTRTLLQNIEVLSAGQNFQKDAAGKPVQVQVVNLLVTPEQAEQVSLASNQTTVQLVLRNPLDTKIASTQGVSTTRLFGGDYKPPAGAADRPHPRPALRPLVVPLPLVVTPRAPPKPYVVEMIHGTKKVDARFQSAPEEQP